MCLASDLVERNSGDLSMMNKKMRWLVLTGAVLASLSLQLEAQVAPSAIGYVKTVTGEAWVNTAGQRALAQPGVAIQIGSQIKTTSDATLGITMKDGTLLSFGPNTDFTVDEYLYAPASDDLKFSSRLAKGTMNYVSGVIAKLRPNAVTVKTPTGIIGVRGTQFVAKVEETQ